MPEHPLNPLPLTLMPYFEQYGMLLDVERAWKFLNGLIPDRGSIVGRDRLRELLLDGTIKAAYRKHKRGRGGVQLVTTTEEMVRFARELLTRGNEALGIMPIKTVDDVPAFKKLRIVGGIGAR